MLKINIKNKIKKTKGLKEKIAIEIGRSVQTVDRWLKTDDDRFLNIKILLLVSKELCIPLLELIGEKAKTEDTESELLEKLLK